MKYLNDPLLAALGLSYIQVALICLALVFITLLYLLFAISDKPKDREYNNYIHNEIVDFPRIEKLNLYRVTMLDGTNKELFAINLIELDKQIPKPFIKIELLA